MPDINELARKISAGELDRVFASLYSDIAAARCRSLELCSEFMSLYGNMSGAVLVSTPGRTEICGNHTDHNNGMVAAAAVELDVLLLAAAANDNIVKLASSGFPQDVLNIDSLLPVEDERGESKALIRGVCAALSSNGRKVGGFRACGGSRVFKGSGLSSSAAFEVAVASCLSALYNKGDIPALELAKAGQYAENVYYGKPCGLLDQTACAVGGFVALDFRDTENPSVERIPLELDKMSLSLCVVETGGSHEDLTEDYASIPREMKSVARYFGKSVLREVTKEQVIAGAKQLRVSCGDRAFLRSLHFFDENERVKRLVNAVRESDAAVFTKTVSASGVSSYMFNQNAYAPNSAYQGLAVAYALSRQLLGENGCYRLQGGGFAGTLQAFCPKDKLTEYTQGMEAVFGEGSCHQISIRNFGTVELLSMCERC